jgi:hypothetical protein
MAAHTLQPPPNREILSSLVSASAVSMSQNFQIVLINQGPAFTDRSEQAVETRGAEKSRKVLRNAEAERRARSAFWTENENMLSPLTSMEMNNSLALPKYCHPPVHASCEKDRPYCQHVPQDCRDCDGRSRGRPRFVTEIRWLSAPVVSNGPAEPYFEYLKLDSNTTYNTVNKTSDLTSHFSGDYFELNGSNFSASSVPAQLIADLDKVVLPPGAAASEAI